MGEKDHLVLSLGKRDPKERRRRHPEPVAPTGEPVELERQTPEHLRQCQSEDAKENPRIADAQEAKQSSDCCGRQNAAEQKDFHGRDVQILHEKGYRIGTHAKVGRVAEREQASVTEEEIKSEGG